MELAIALNSALIAFSHASVEAGRGTGRTTRMLREAKEGDFIVVPSDGCARYIRSLLRESENGTVANRRDITVIVSAPDLSSLSNALGRACKGRSGAVHIDHFWVERYMIDMLQHNASQLQSFSEQVLRQTLESRKPDERNTFGLRHRNGFGSRI